MDLLHWLFDARIVIGDQTILWREVIGNLFGLFSALGAMRRRIWAWPVGIAGNALLFTVFLGSVFYTPHPIDLLGQAGRQVMFILVSIYGWHRWAHPDAAASEAVTPRWASGRARVGLVVGLLAGTTLLTPIFGALGSYEPVWSDAWIFTGSLLATYAMAKGWVEFWLVWIVVDAVGVPLLVSAGYYASAVMYVVYGSFSLAGFFVWMRGRVPNVIRTAVSVG